MRLSQDMTGNAVNSKGFERKRLHSQGASKSHLTTVMFPSFSFLILLNGGGILSELLGWSNFIILVLLNQNISA